MYISYWDPTCHPVSMLMKLLRTSIPACDDFSPKLIGSVLLKQIGCKMNISPDSASATVDEMIKGVIEPQ